MEENRIERKQNQEKLDVHNAKEEMERNLAMPGLLAGEERPDVYINKTSAA